MFYDNSCCLCSGVIIYCSGDKMIIILTKDDLGNPDWKPELKNFRAITDDAVDKAKFVLYIENNQMTRLKTSPAGANTLAVLDLIKVG